MTDFKQHLIRQMVFSRATFGPGERREGVLDHMNKEIAEVRESKGEASEWVDLVILALDGLTRRLWDASGYSKSADDVAEEAVRMIVGKQGRNERQAAVQVKPLVWIKTNYISTDDDGGPMEGVPRSLSAWKSYPYLIIRQLGEHGLFILHGKSDGIGLVVSKLSEAQAAAQADYEARIRAALKGPNDE
ncbi:MAG: DUF550 domain-containing protein [Rhodobacteraceae bacterium]|nr:DUF550 domain-containing protein [Paracoccaceae bacterium]